MKKKKSPKTLGAWPNGKIEKYQLQPVEKASTTFKNKSIWGIGFINCLTKLPILDLLIAFSKSFFIPGNFAIRNDIDLFF